MAITSAPTMFAGTPAREYVVRFLKPDVVDNLCHSLVGAAMSGAGLRRRTGLATATMVIGANLPDVDVLVYVMGSGGASGLAFRRGWTHGVLAMIVLPFVLAGLMMWVGRALEARRARRRRARAPQPVVFSQLLIVSAISIWSHPLFDLLNTYGVRLLMPFSSRWFYGDTLFIIDPWVWAVLAIGTFISLRRARAVPVGAGSKPVMTRAERPARIAIAAVVTYIAAMAISGRVGRSIVERQAVASGSQPSLRVMVAPEPINPYARSVIRDMGQWYELGRLTFSPQPHYAVVGEPIVKITNAAPAAALATREGKQFASWARFPFAEITNTRDSMVVRFDDARYAAPGRASFASVVVRLPGSPPAPEQSAR